MGEGEIFVGAPDSLKKQNWTFSIKQCLGDGRIGKQTGWVWKCIDVARQS